MTASADGQLLMLHEQLSAARDKLRICADEACPKLVRHDCDEWLDEIERNIPTFVFSVRDASGNDIASAKVLEGATILASRSDGKAVTVDPGEHHLRIEADGFTPVERSVVARQGEKNRLIDIVLASNAVVVAPVVVEHPIEREKPPPLAPLEPPKKTHGAGFEAGFVLGAVGLGALGVSLGFELSSLDDYNRLKDTCAPTGTCAQSDVDAIVQKRTVSGVSLGIGAAFVVVGTILILTSSPSKPKLTSLTSNGFAIRF